MRRTFATLAFATPRPPPMKSSRLVLPIALLLSCAPCSVWAQSPFDLDRAPGEGRSGPASPSNSAPDAVEVRTPPPTAAIESRDRTPVAPRRIADDTAARARSPFDLERGGRSAAAPPPSAVADEAAPRTASAGRKPIPRSRFDALLCTGLLILFSVTFVAQGGSLRRMWNSAFNANLLTRLQREQRKVGYYWWAFLGAVVLGAFAYAVLRELRPGTVPEGWGVLDAFVLAAVGLTLARLLVLGALAWAFPLAKPLGAYRTLVVVWAGVIGAVLFPALVLVCFAPPAIAVAVCYVGGGAVGVAYLWRGLRALGAAGRYVTGHPGHFLLYFCALEISPLAIGITWLTS